MVGHGGSSAGSYLAVPTSPIPSHCASIVVTSTLRVNNLPETRHSQKHQPYDSSMYPSTKGMIMGYRGCRAWYSIQAVTMRVPLRTNMHAPRGTVNPTWMFATIQAAKAHLKQSNHIQSAKAVCWTLHYIMINAE